MTLQSSLSLRLNVFQKTNVHNRLLWVHIAFYNIICVTHLLVMTPRVGKKGEKTEKRTKHTGVLALPIFSILVLLFSIFLHKYYVAKFSRTKSPYCKFVSFCYFFFFKTILELSAFFFIFLGCPLVHQRFIQRTRQKRVPTSLIMRSKRGIRSG